MNTSTSRSVKVIAILCATVVALPPAFAMDVMERIITTQTQMIRHEASEYQRKVAEANARAYMAAQLKSYRRSKGTSEEPTPKPGKTTNAPTPKPHKHEVTEKEVQAPPTAEEKKALKKKLPRYIAVETPMDKKSPPGTKKDVMLWDTQNESLVGNNVYDVTTTPTKGAMNKFDTYSAQYVGNGL
jgi:hypothetical protein